MSDALSDPVPSDVPPSGAVLQELRDLSHKVDVVAGAVAAIAAGHHELLDHLAESVARQSHDALEVADRLSAIERQVLAASGGGAPVPAEADAALFDRLEAIERAVAALGPRVNELLDRHPGGLPLPPRLLADEGSPRPSTEVDLSPLQGQVADLVEVTASQANDLTLALEVLSKVADGIDRLDARTEDRLAALRDVAALAVLTPAPVTPTPAASSDPLLEARLTHHIDTALAGVLRLFDDRLVALRASLGTAASMSTVAAPAPAPAGSMAGYEAGAVMGAAQAAWSRLEQRIDEEFDDLSRQLQALAALVEQAVASTEELANRPVVTGDQVKRAAVTLRDTVVNASRQRRERRGGPKGLGPGSGSSGY